MKRSNNETQLTKRAEAGRGSGGSSGKATKGAFRQLSIVMLAGMAVLAALSLIEFAFPKLAWFTFPAMVVGLVFVVGVRLFHRTQAWIATFQWLRWLAVRDRKKPPGANSPGPIGPD